MTGEKATFRYTLGMIAVMGGLGGLYCLFFVEVPEGNIEPLLLALGIVLGWGGSVISGEWGSSPAGRKAADVGVRLAEVQQPPTGTPENPTIIEGAGPGAAPVATREG